MKKTLHSWEQDVLLSLLRDIRAEAGLTQIELGRRLEVPQSWVSDYERGNGKLDILQIRQICRAVGLTLTEFAVKLDRALEERE